MMDVETNINNSIILTYKFIIYIEQYMIVEEFVSIYHEWLIEILVDWNWIAGDNDCPSQMVGGL